MRPAAAAPPARPVLVTGGSGYIAGFLIQRLLAEGCTVHTTVRSRSREASLRALLQAHAAAGAPAAAGERLRVFEADLTADAGWAEAAAGCGLVAHLASPLPRGVPKNADELIVPARDGARRALRAARDAGAQRVVMTSSVAAVAYGHGRDGHGSGERRYTEADWTQLSQPGLTPYIRSKTIAERAARDWVAAEGGGLELCTINPSVVLGPVWSGDYSASVVLVKMLLDGRVRACPDIGFGIVDVRDVADLHWRALVTPGLAGERFIASGRFMKMIEVAGVLRAALGPQAARVPTRTVADWLMRLAAPFSSVARAVATELGTVRHHDASHARERLGWQTRAVEDSILDCARSLLEQGLLRA
ncbi:MAG: NAD-dependent epimerase/dehydratase family protein [Rubrivivax sp.]|nr:NAD-dependent epimerase/dehydratase family protein [Rubrivivax sp.]